MSDQAIPREKRQVPKIVLGLAAVAVIGPLFLLRRLHTRTARFEHVQLSSGAAPPIRRPGAAFSTTAAVVPTAASENVTPAVGWTGFGHAGEEEDDYGTPPPPQPDVEDVGGGRDINNALDAFKAITVATTFVGLSAAGIFFGVKSWMGVKTIDEFAIRMRAALSGTGLNDRIDDSFVDSVSHMSEDDATTSLEASPWTWAAAQKRLAKAYEEGGAPRWTEQLAREAEAEARIELARRTATVEHNRRQNERPSTVA